MGAIFIVLFPILFSKKGNDMSGENSDIFQSINYICKHIFLQNKSVGWWPENPKERNVGELLCLVHSEVSEAMEGYRKGLKDDHLPNRDMFEVELADIVIRIFDLAGAHDLDLAGAIREKLEYNRQRLDHKLSERMKDGGKKF